MFKESVKCVSRKFQIKFSSMFQWSFCNFIVAWISSQLPEQKEGLFRTGKGGNLWLVSYSRAHIYGGGGNGNILEVRCKRKRKYETSKKSLLVKPQFFGGKTQD